jgi:hypothetical protein
MRFIATLQRNMEKAMRHVRPPITLTPIILYKDCHMAVCRSSDDINRKTWRTSMDTISPEDTTFRVCVLGGLYPYGFTSAQTPYA